MFASTNDLKPEKTLLLCITAHFVNDGLDVLLPIIMPLLVLRYTLSLFEVGLILTSYSATTVIFQPLLGYLADITGHKRIYLALGLILMALSFYFIQFFPSLSWIILLALISGIGYSVYHPVAISFINNAFMEKRGFGVGFHGLGGSIGRGIFPALLGILLVTYDMSSALLFSLAIGLLAGILVLNLPAEVKERKERKFKVNLPRIIITASMIQLLRTIFYVGTVNFIPTYIVKELHLDIAAAGISTSIMLILGIVSQPLGGYMSDKIGRRAVLILSSFSMGFFFILFLRIPYPTSLVLLSLVGFWIFLGFPIPYAVVGDNVPKESISTSLGIISGVGSAGGIIAPLFIGSIGDKIGLGNAMFFASIFSFIAAAVCLILPKGAKNENNTRVLNPKTS